MSEIDNYFEREAERDFFAFQERQLREVRERRESMNDYQNDPEYDRAKKVADSMSQSEINVVLGRVVEALEIADQLVQAIMDAPEIILMNPTIGVKAFEYITIKAQAIEILHRAEKDQNR